MILFRMVCSSVTLISMSCWRKQTPDQGHMDPNVILFSASCQRRTYRPRQLPEEALETSVDLALVQMLLRHKQESSFQPPPLAVCLFYARTVSFHCLTSFGISALISSSSSLTWTERRAFITATVSLSTNRPSGQLQGYCA